MLAKAETTMGDWTLTFLTIRTHAMVIKATLGEQYRKNNSSSCSEQSGTADMVLNPTYVAAYPIASIGKATESVLPHFHSSTSLMRKCPSSK